MPSSEKVLSLKRQALQAKKEGDLERAKTLLRQAKQVEKEEDQQQELQLQQPPQQQQEQTTIQDTVTAADDAPTTSPSLPEDPVNAAIDNANLEELSAPSASATTFGYTELIDVESLQDLRDCGLEIPSQEVYDKHILASKKKALQYKKANDMSQAKQALLRAKQLQTAKDTLYSSSTQTSATSAGDSELLAEMNAEDMGLLAELMNYDEEGRNLHDTRDPDAAASLEDNEGSKAALDTKLHLGDIEDDVDVGTLVDMVEAGFTLPTVDEVQSLAQQRQAAAVTFKKQGDLPSAKAALVESKRLQQKAHKLAVAADLLSKKQPNANSTGEHAVDPDAALEQLLSATQNGNHDGKKTSAPSGATRQSKKHKDQHKPSAAVKDPLAQVPAKLRIKVLYRDEAIIVIGKPSNLRSVPGHANPPPSDTSTGSQSSNVSAQEAWVEAIRQLSETPDETAADTHEFDNSSVVRHCLQRLGADKRQCAAVPRRYAPFVRYLERSRQRILGQDYDGSYSSPEKFQQLAKQLFTRIENVQKDIFVRPARTTQEESVPGQCQLLGLARSTDSRANQDLFVIHRLDCATSGVMVLARTQAAASFLSECWRARKHVSKVYRAFVKNWIDGDEGEISLPLAPHPTERLKWQVVDRNDPTGKESLTLWKVLERRPDGVSLELKPVTGRTHQLRVHCQATGGAIFGDSLYGSTGGETLFLHAERLSFPHPLTQKVVSFRVDPDWTQLKTAQRQACIDQLQAEVDLAQEQARLFAFYQSFVDTAKGASMAAGWRRYGRDCAAYALRLQEESQTTEDKKTDTSSSPPLLTTLERSTQPALYRLDDLSLSFVGSSCDVTEQRLEIRLVGLLGLSSNQHFRRAVPDWETQPVPVSQIRVRLTAHLPAHEHALEEDVRLEFEPTTVLTQGSESIYTFQNSQFLQAERGTNSRFAKTFARRLTRRRCVTLEVVHLEAISTSKGLFGRLGNKPVERKETSLGVAALELGDLLQRNYVAADVPLLESRRQVGGILRIVARSGGPFGNDSEHGQASSATAPSLQGYRHLLLPR